MFNKHSIFMMLPIVTASLVGLSTVYKPVNVETQPQQQQPQIQTIQSDPEDSYVTTVSPDRQNGWYSGALMGDNGKIQSFVTCLTINVGLKGVQQPQQPPQQPSQPSPPPGGPPLQPPTNLR